MKDSKEITIGKRVLDDSTRFHWQDVSLDDFKTDRPIVLIFGGDGTKTDRAANGYAKFVSSMLGVFADEVDIYSVNYRKIFENDDDKRRVQELFVDKIFLPLVSKDGRKIAVEAACKNLRKITLFAHCCGKTNFDFMLNTFLIKCSLLNYSYAQTSKMLEQIFLVSYGIWARESLVPTLNILSPYDQMWAASERSWEELVKRLDDVKMSIEDRQKLKELTTDSFMSVLTQIWQMDKFFKQNDRCFVMQDKNILRLTGSAFHNDRSDDHPLYDLRRQPGWKPTDRVSKTGDYVSRCIGCALCNSVANSLQNQQTKELIPFSLADLKVQLESIVRPLNQDKSK